MRRGLPPRKISTMFRHISKAIERLDERVARWQDSLRLSAAEYWIYSTIIGVSVGLTLKYLFFSDEWLGHVYPNSDNLLYDINIGKYESLESCRDAAIERLKRGGWLITGDYECGLNCEFDGELGIYICEETLD